MRYTLPKQRVIRLVGRFTALALLLAMAGPGPRVSAQTSGGFSIRAIIPDNQWDTRQTYFDLRMNPGDEQTVQIVVTNSRSEELVAEVSLNAASTARDGLIVYTTPNVRDEIMEVATTDVATLRQQTVRVPPYGSETVDILLKMPEDRFDGVILGGIAVTASEGDGETEAAQGVSIKNTITYVIALKLTETDREVAPDFDLTAITPSLINHRTALAVTLRNNAARIVKGMEVQAQVYRKGSDTVLKERMIEEAEMAPLSTGDFIVEWGGEALKAGTYRLRMSAAYEGRLWEWDEEFVIASEADQLNQSAVGIVRDYRWLCLAAGLLLLLLVWMIAYRLGKRRKHEA